MINAVNSIVNPLRNYTSDGAKACASVTSPPSSYAYIEYDLGSPTDLRNIMTQVVNYSISMPTHPISVEPFDLKYVIESAMHRDTITNVTTIPVKITCYWARPRKDLYEQATAASSFTALAQTSTNSRLTTNGLSDLTWIDPNYRLYDSNACVYWKITRRKTCIVQPGCSVDFSMAMGRHIVSYRELYPTVSIPSPSQIRKHTQVMFFQFSAAVSGLNQPSTGPHAVALPPFGVLIQPKEEYQYRALVDPRPVFDQYASSLSSVSAPVNCIQPQNGGIDPAAQVT